MNEDAWPSRDEPAARAPLPRVEDLPIAEQGYDRDAVQGAFDAFYRHTAQLDATLRTLETVDTFTRQAAELRADLRTLRSAGLGPQAWSSPYSTPTSERVGISPAVPRIVAELVFVAAVPIVAGLVGNFDSTVVLAVTLAAWALMLLIEYTAYRSRIAPSVVPRLQPSEPAAVVVDAPVETPPTWDEIAARDDALTMIAPPSEVAEAAAEPAAIVEPPTPEPTFPGPPAAPTVEPPAPEPSIAPPAPEPTFPPTAPEPTFPPEPPAPEPEPTPEPEPEPEPPQPVAETEEPHRRFGVFRRSRPAEAEPVEEAQPAAESELEPALEAKPEPEPEPEPEPAEEPQPLVAEEKPRRLFGRRRADEIEQAEEAEVEPIVAEAEPEPTEEPEAIAEEKPPRRLFGRRREQEVEPVLEAAAEPEPVEAYVDPWERDFEYSAPEEPEAEPEPVPEPVLEHEDEAPALEEPTQEPLAAERSELELDEQDENGNQPVVDHGVPAAASRTPEYTPRRGRRR